MQIHHAFLFVLLGNKYCLYNIYKISRILGEFVKKLPYKSFKDTSVIFSSIQLSHDLADYGDKTHEIVEL